MTHTPTTSLESLMNELSNLTILQAVDLTKQLEEKWGVKAASGMPSALPPFPGQSGEAAPAKAPEKDSWEVVLLDAGSDKIKTIGVIRPALGGIGLKEANEICKTLPKTIKADMDKEGAEALLKQFEAVGAKAEIK